jgi:hypothetical protein
MAMNDDQPWEFTCATCGGHKLTVYRVWNILAGPESETWQEWGPLEADHTWVFEFKEKVENDKDDEVERGILASSHKTTLLPNQKTMKFSSRKLTRVATSFM